MARDRYITSGKAWPPAIPFPPALVSARAVARSPSGRCLLFTLTRPGVVLLLSSSQSLTFVPSHLDRSSLFKKVQHVRQGYPRCSRFFPFPFRLRHSGGEERCHLRGKSFFSTATCSPIAHRVLVQTAIKTVTVTATAAAAAATSVAASANASKGSKGASKGGNNGEYLMGGAVSGDVDVCLSQRCRRHQRCDG